MPNTRTPAQRAYDEGRILSYLAKYPGARSPEALAELAMNENHYYTSVQALEKAGLIRCEGKKNRRLWVVGAEVPAHVQAAQALQLELDELVYPEPSWTTTELREGLLADAVRLLEDDPRPVAVSVASNLVRRAMKL